ncbi:hypothetical protein RUND412_006701 [Rhizina undulata]
MTFGIELEVVLSGVRNQDRTDTFNLPIHHIVARALERGGIFADTHDRTSSMDKPPLKYKFWTVTLDESIQYNPDDALKHAGRILTKDEEKNVFSGAIELISSVLRIVQEYFVMTFNATTALHVHIGYGVESVPLDAWKHIAAVIIVFENVLDRLHSPDRSGDSIATNISNPYTKSNRNNKWLADAPPAELIKRIMACKKTKEFQNLVNCGSDDVARKKYKYSFMSFKTTGTVEFRQHGGTNDTEAIYNWIQLTCTLVQRAIELGEGLVPLVMEMDLEDREFMKNDLWRLLGDSSLMEYYD